jgi:hypothetical protein
MTGIEALFVPSTLTDTLSRQQPGRKVDEPPRHLARKHMTEKKLKEYRAIILIGGRVQTQPGLRVTVMATDGEEAFMLLEEKHGKGTVFDLHNEEEASTIR